MFSMSEPFQKYLYGRTKEGFGLNNQLVRMWNEPAMEGKWSFTYPTRKEWPLKDMKDQRQELLDNRNCSVSFWMYVNKNVGNWNHIISLRSPKTDRYLGIWIWPNNPALHIRSTTDEKRNSGGDFQGETGNFNQNEENNNFSLNRAIFVVVTLETPNPSPEQLKADPEKQYDSLYRIYLDGVHKNTHVHSSTIKSLQEDEQAHIMVGRTYGKIDNYVLKDIHLYNHTIGQTDIQNLYTAIKHQNDPDGAKALFTEKEGFQSNNQTKDRETKDRETKDRETKDRETKDRETSKKEGFVTAQQCRDVVLPGYKQYFDFYKNVKIARATGNPCHYNHGATSVEKQVHVGSNKNGPKQVDLPGNIGKYDRIDPSPVNHMHPQWKDTFRLEREGENDKSLKVYRTDPAYKEGDKTAGWGMDLTLGSTGIVFTKNNIDWEKYYDRYPDFVTNHLPRTLDAVWNHWNRWGKTEGRVMTVKDQSKLTCGSSKPVCVDSNVHQYGMCGKEERPFKYDPVRDKVTLQEHRNDSKSNWEVDLQITRIPNMASHNGKNLRGLSAIVIPENMKVVIYDQPNFSGNKMSLVGPQTVHLNARNNDQFDNKVQSLKVKQSGLRFKTTYNNDDANPIYDKDHPLLEQDDLGIEDTLDKHFDMNGQKKKMRFIEFESNADWRKGTRIHTSFTYEDAKQKTLGKRFTRLDFQNMNLRLGNNGMTFCLWFKCKGDNNEQWARLFDFGDGYHFNNILMAFSGKQLHFRVVKPGTTDTWESVLPNVNDNEWYHLAWVIGKPDKNGKCDWTTYVNGVTSEETKQKQQNYPPDVVRKNLFLGASNYWWDPHFNGCIADPRIYKEPLNDAQVCKVYNNPDPQD